MTSPIDKKPEQITNGKYDGVFGRGSSFGQGLNEQSVRDILSHEVKSPFVRAMEKISKAFNDFAADVAAAFRGDGGAKYTVIASAVSERLGPIDSAITESGKEFKRIADKLEKSDKVQAGLVEDGKKTAADAKSALSKAEANRTDLAAFRKDISEKVVTLTASADSAIKRADAVSEKQAEIISNADKQKQVVDQAVLDLSTVTNNFNSYKQAQDEQLRKLSAQADKGVADAKKANDAIAKTNSELSANIAAGVAASQDLKDAKRDASKAAAGVSDLDKAMRASVDIGASLVPLVTGTRIPTWMSDEELVVSTGEEGTPVAGLQVATQGEARGREYPLPEKYVKVSDQVLYKVSFWARSAKAPTRFRLSMRTPGSTSSPVDRAEPVVFVPTKHHDPELVLLDDPDWVIGVEGIDSAWRRVEYTFKFLPGTEYVSFYYIEWSRGLYPLKIAQQWIADLRIEPVIPDQATIDRLQNEAILKNEKVGSTNATAIEVMEESWKAQKVVNDNQEKWNESVGTAVQANTDAIKALARKDTGQSLIQYLDLTPEEVAEGKREVWRPLWTTATQLHKPKKDDPAFFTAPRGVGFACQEAWGVPKGVGSRFADKHWMRVEEGRQYKLTYWHKASEPDSIYHLQAVSPTGEPNPFRIVRGTRSDGSPQLGRATTYFVSALTMPTEWERVEVIVQIEPGVTQLYLRTFYWNHSRGKAKADQWFAGLDFGPNLPSQADIDSAQNNAISALAKQSELHSQFQEEQKKWNDTSSDATKALSRATKLLAKPEYGDSLIAYKQPSAEDLDNPSKQVNWERPEWSDAFDSRGANAPAVPGGTWRFWPATSGSFIREAQKTYLPLKQGVEYRLSFWARGNGEVSFVTGNGSGAVEYSRQVTVDSKGEKVYQEVRSGNGYVVRDLPVTSTMRRYEFVIKFRDGATSTAITHFVFDVSAGKSIEIGAIVFEPNVPTQAEVDKAQDEAIKANQESAKLSTQFQEEQRRVNRLTQQQLWLHQDMIELLDIRAPKVYGWKSRFFDSSGWVKHDLPLPDDVLQWTRGNNAVYTQDYAMDTPYAKVYDVSSGKNGSTILACKGDWVGRANIAISWNTGVVDDWVVEVTEKDRIFKFVGGASHISKRFISLKIYPRSLRRKATVRILPAGKQSYASYGIEGSRYWGSTTDRNGLVRYNDPAVIRLKNTVVCNRDLYVRDEGGGLIPVLAGHPLYAQELHIDDQKYPDMTTLTFTEVGDPVTNDINKGGYSLPDRMWGQDQKDWTSIYSYN